MSYNPDGGQIPRPENLPLGGIGETRFAGQSAAFLPNDDFTTFEINRLPEKKPARKLGKKLVPVLFGVLALILLPLIGFTAWLILSPDRADNSSEKTEAPKSERQSTLSPLESGKTAENPVKV
ncbi:MAG TPA: hypothetical protein VK892_16450, partial [Pyrinomonadaceae bacterium]|nr:hypothetical protein [Pyrinomonadaceae bacterium]